ncbi:MAG: hypothetical protein ACYCOU_02380 [Sulfobacillus sp.]
MSLIVVLIAIVAIDLTKPTSPTIQPNSANSASPAVQTSPTKTCPTGYHYNGQICLPGCPPNWATMPSVTSGPLAGIWPPVCLPPGTIPNDTVTYGQANCPKGTSAYDDFSTGKLRVGCIADCPDNMVSYRKYCLPKIDTCPSGTSRIQAGCIQAPAQPLSCPAGTSLVQGIACLDPHRKAQLEAIGRGGGMRTAKNK